MATPKPDYKKLMQKALSEIKDLRSQLQQQQNKSEPIAIVGMGCRFPGGANTPEAFWQLLVDGVDAISEVPGDRWNIRDYYDAHPVTPGKMYTRYGGFVDGLKEFDAEFFGISPREAISLDPQQRLLLEVTWEALERAGVVPLSQASKNTGVFVGISSSDYCGLLLERETTEIDAYLATGNSHSTAAGRISYLLGFTAPSIAVDTACSSSLVAVHLACRSLRDHECNLAVAGGVHRLITPEFTINFSQARMLAADGRCKTFDAAADGFSRGEGCGMVVLKRLADAIRDGDCPLAIIRGSAVNQDGRSSGLTVPNGVSQQRVIQQALANSGVKAEDISYIEAHGTGTTLGDPIEITALGEVFQRNSHNPLLVGSVKTNIGHLEAAAGIAGLIKVVLSLQHQQIPPHLHFTQPNPHIDWDNVGVSVTSGGKAWQVKPRLAGISSFGFSGTNAHVVLESWDTQVEVDTERRRRGDGERDLLLLTLSAKNKQALHDLVKRYQQYLTPSASPALKDICYTASVGRTHFDYRLGIIFEDVEELNSKLAAFINNEETPGVYQGNSKSKNQKIAFLFTGQGSQYVDMGKELYQTQPVFRENCDRCFQLLQPYLDIPLSEIIYPSFYGDGGQGGQGNAMPPRRDIDQTQYTQPAIFALEYALAQMWMSWGIQPDVVMGHSIGEFVAATIAGVFSLEDALKLVATRSKLMQKLPSNGAMYVVQASEQLVNRVIQSISGVIAIAAVNGLENTVISGETAAVEEALAKLTEGIAAFDQNKIKTTQLQVSHAFHSPLMESILPAFTAVAREINYATPKIPFVSNVTGKKCESEITTAQYWVDHICQPVRFAQGMETLAALKCNVFLEIGAKPILLGMGRNILTSPLTKGGWGGSLWLPSLRFGQWDWQSILSSVANLYTYNINLDWHSFFQGEGKILPLPTYPFQRQQYWLSGNKKRINVAIDRLPLLGSELKLAKSKSRIWHNQVTKNEPHYLADHLVRQQVIFPGAGYIEMALTAGKKVFDSGYLELSKVSFHQPLVLGDWATEVQLHLEVTQTSELNDQNYSFEILSLNNNSNWISHSQGKIVNAKKINSYSNLTKYQQEIDRPIHIEQYYQNLAQRGLEYGESFQAIAKLYNSNNRALGKINLPNNLIANNADYTIHPVLLDACLQVTGAAINSEDNSSYLPIELESLVANFNHTLDTLWCYAEVASYNSGIYTINFELLNEQQIVGIIRGFKIKSTSVSSKKNSSNLDDWLYQIEWRDYPLTEVTNNTSISLAEINKTTATKFSELTTSTEFSNYLKLLSELENLSVAYIVEALEKLGVEFSSEELFDSSIEQWHIIEQQELLWQRILEILVEAEIVKETNNVWKIVEVPDKIDVTKKYQQLLAQYPQAKAELDLLHRCASQLDCVLNGNINPKELLFPGGNLSNTTSLYQDSPGAKVTNTLVAEAIKQALVYQPNKTIKLLEIGAGTGGTTSYILPHLNPQRTEYTFTDLSPLFLTKAKEKFKEYDYISYQLLDISEPLQNEQTYDIIIAANVLHATPNLQQSLNNIRQLLSPGGILILVEGTQPMRWFDLTFGMTEAWWSFTDRDLRSNYPLISVNRWQQLLLDTNFSRVINLCSTASNNLDLQAVIVAGASKLNTQPQQYLILGEGKIVRQISNRLAELNHNSTLVFPGSSYQQNQENEYQINPLDPDDYNRLFDDLKQKNKLGDRYAGGLPHRIIYLQSLDRNSNNLASDITNNTNAALYFTQSLIKNAATSKLYLVTRGAVNLDREITIEGLSQSPLSGLAKVINLEHPQLNCTCIDLDPRYTIEQQIENLIAEIQSMPKSEQILWRNHRRKVARLIPYQPESEFFNLPEDQPYQLSITKRGTPKNLQLTPLQRRHPQAEEVEIQVKTTGLNFIDVLDTLGLLPFDKDWFGVECAGKIVAVGESVTDFAVGDRVIALAAGGFNQYVTVNQTMVVAKPDNLNWEEAVTIPANFLTASYALEECRRADGLGGQRKHTRILIHAAAGGTGMAAVQIAQRLGMEIFATASPSKWEFLKSLGIKHVMNSRSLDFADEIMRLTDGEGVDIVFNSLSGEFIDRSLSVLKVNGHFLEIGKRHLRSAAEITQINPNVNYTQIDLFTIAPQQPNLIKALLTRLVTQFSTGELKPLPYKTFPIQQTIAAFQYMQQAKHIGKIAIKHDNSTDIDRIQPQVKVMHSPSSNSERLRDLISPNIGGLGGHSSNYLSHKAIKNNCTYLIAGGLGDLGLLVANWLVEKGAKYLILISRNQPSEYAQQQIKNLENQQATIEVIQADITDYKALEKIWTTHNLTSPSPPLPPLAGVIHSAGVLDDGMLLNMDAARMKTVMNPKVLGAWNLHQLTKDISLDFFILFSSAASLLGSPGQTNHVVANSFLDALAHYRKAQGLPALSLNWGPWSDIGAAAKRQVDRQMNLKGIGAIMPTKGLQILENLMVQSIPQVGIIPVNWSKLITAGYNLPLVSDFPQNKKTQTSNIFTSNFLAEINTAKPENKLKFLTNFLQIEVGKVLGLPPNQLPNVNQGFFDIGMDSLMAIELKSKLENSLQINIPSTAIFEYSNISLLADYIFQEILHLETTKSEPPTAEVNKSSTEELSIAQDLPDLKSSEELEAIANELSDLESLL